MIITWSCPKCIRTHSSKLLDGGNRLVCPVCKWVWYLDMTCYETQRQQETTIIQEGLETKIIPVDSSDNHG
jgi:hypothetical protein